MKKQIRIISLFWVIIILCAIMPASVFAIYWDGSSANTGSGGKPADVNGYALRYYPGDNCVGYRFSCVDKNGNNRVSKVIDVPKFYSCGAKITNAYLSLSSLEYLTVPNCQDPA